MSDPNRYHLWAALECHAFSKAEAVLRFSAEEDGMWVQWQDYCRLQAEVQRLRKAGDAMEIALQADFNGCPYEPLVIMQAIRRWRTAKEGKPSV
jgi:hypothetical protein